MSIDNYSIQGEKSSDITDYEHDSNNLSRYKEYIKYTISETDPRVDTSFPFRTDVRAEIRTQSKEPIWSRQYPYPLSVNSFVNMEIKRMLNEGIIRSSKSPYNSPIWVVPKKGTNDDGSPKFRMVIDYKKLNEKTIPDRYPIPDTNIILSNLGKAKYFSSIDLESGFHQILMSENDIEKTAFSVNNGKYEFLRMPFGLKNAPRIFQRAMDDILREQIGKICHVYMDDIIIFSENLEQHIEDLETVIEILKKANMKISIEKSKFFKTEIEFLGYIIAQNTIKTDPHKIELMLNYPLPKNLRELRGFLGITGYYRKFVKDYAAIAKPLTKYLSAENGRVSKNMSKKVLIQIDEAGISAFNMLKRNLASEMELTQRDYSKKFVLPSNASNVAIGAVLSQEN